MSKIVISILSANIFSPNSTRINISISTSVIHQHWTQQNERLDVCMCTYKNFYIHIIHTSGIKKDNMNMSQ